VFAEWCLVPATPRFALAGSRTALTVVTAASAFALANLATAAPSDIRRESVRMMLSDY
jgi:hypothetical protein